MVVETDIRNALEYLFGRDLKEIERNEISDEDEVSFSPIGRNGIHLGIEIVLDMVKHVACVSTFYGNGHDSSLELINHEWRNNIFLVARDVMLYNIEGELHAFSEWMLFKEMNNEENNV